MTYSSNSSIFSYRFCSTKTGNIKIESTNTKKYGLDVGFFFCTTKPIGDYSRVRWVHLSQRYRYNGIFWRVLITTWLQVQYLYSTSIASTCTVLEYNCTSSKPYSVRVRVRVLIVTTISTETDLYSKINTVCTVSYSRECTNASSHHDARPLISDSSLLVLHAVAIPVL